MSLSAHFPSLVTGAIPPSVSCVITISPLLDLRYFYAWRLFLESVCGKSSWAANIPYIELFLERGLACMNSDTYLGVVLPSDLIHNFAFYFTMLRGLPTINPTSPFDDFARSEVVSPIAQTYPLIPIQVHWDQPAPGADVEPPTTTPAGTNLFGKAVAVYSPPLHRGYHSQLVPPTALTSRLALFPSPVSVKSKWDEITSWNLLSGPAQNACAQEYLMLCLCIIHGPTLLDLFHADYRPNRCFSQLGEKRLYAPSPSLYCSTRLLLPIFSTGASFLPALPVSSTAPGFISRVLSIDRAKETLAPFIPNHSFKQQCLKIYSNWRRGAWKIHSNPPTVTRLPFTCIISCPHFGRTPPLQPSCQPRVLHALSLSR